MAQSAVIRGVILDEASNPINAVNIKANTGEGTASNENGFYELRIAPNIEVTIVFSHVSHKKLQVKFNLKNGQELEFNPCFKN
jgi:hypothetical protein